MSNNYPDGSINDPNAPWNDNQKFTEWEFSHVEICKWCEEDGEVDENQVCKKCFEPKEISEDDFNKDD